VIVLVAFSVTTSTSPCGVKPICAGAVEAALNGRVDPASGVRLPSVPSRNPLILFGLPALSTYTRSPWSATLTGRSPPLDATSVNRRPPGSMANTDTSSVPAFTTRSQRPLAERTTPS
jgi:hypothetical protein